jgi:hypothetical protein
MAIPTILKGDTSAKVFIDIADGYDYGDVTLHVSFCGANSVFPSIKSGDRICLHFSAEETCRFPLGTHKAMMRFCNSAGEIKTLPWAKIKVTDAPGEVYDTPIYVDPSQLDVLEALPADTQGDVKAKLNAIIKYLRGGVLAFVACFALPCFSLDKATKIDDISGTNTIGDIGKAIGAVDQQTLDNAIRTKRDKSDLTVYSSDAKNGWGIKSFDVEQSFDFTGSNSWGWQSWKAEIFSYDGQKAKWQDSEFEMNWIESTNGVDFDVSCILPHEFSITSLTGSTHNAKWWIKVYYADSLATMSAITNAARDVVNSLYDEEMGVTWQAKMNGGNLYYIAVTNVNLEVTR